MQNSEVSGSHGGENEDDSVLRYSTVKSSGKNRHFRGACLHHWGDEYAMHRKSAANIGTGLAKISPGHNDSYISG
jgi:hypothetical protein